jgi:hypothetical protein
MRVIAAAIFVFIGFILLGGLAPAYIGSIGTAAAIEQRGQTYTLDISQLFGTPGKGLV